MIRQSHINKKIKGSRFLKKNKKTKFLEFVVFALFNKNFSETLYVFIVIALVVGKSIYKILYWKDEYFFHACKNANKALFFYTNLFQFLLHNW